MQASNSPKYRITVEGILDPMWLQCLGGFDATEQRQPEQPVVTWLEGCPVDQAALQGVLDTMFMLGMRLIRVECLPPGCDASAPDSECGEAHHTSET